MENDELRKNAGQEKTPFSHVNVEKCRIEPDIRLQQASGLMQEVMANGKPKMGGIDGMREGACNEARDAMNDEGWTIKDERWKTMRISERRERGRKQTKSRKETMATGRRGTKRSNKQARKQGSEEARKQGSKEARKQESKQERKTEV